MRSFILSLHLFISPSIHVTVRMSGKIACPLIKDKGERNRWVILLSQTTIVKPPALVLLSFQSGFIIKCVPL